MNDIFSFIVPIIAIIFWLFGLSKSKEEQNKKQSPQMPKPSTQQTASKTQQRQSDTTTRSIPDYQGSKTTTVSKERTFAQQKEQQMEKLRDKIKLAEDIRDKARGQELGMRDGIKDSPPLKQRQTRSVYEKDITLSVAKNLTSKGIAQGIIMSEVLGPPRAYQKRKYSRNYRA